MKKKSEKHLSIRRSISIFIIICLIFGILPKLNLVNIKAADASLENPLKDYSFNEDNVKTLDISVGNYIYIYDDGYVQNTRADTSKTNIVSHTGNYTITGVSTESIKVFKMSGNSDIKLKSMTCTKGITLTTYNSSNIIVEDYVKSSGYSLEIISNDNLYDINVIGINTSTNVSSLNCSGNNINISNYVGQLGSITATKSCGVYNSTFSKPNTMAINVIGENGVLNIENSSFTIGSAGASLLLATLTLTGTVNIHNSHFSGGSNVLLYGKIVNILNTDFQQTKFLVHEVNGSTATVKNLNTTEFTLIESETSTSSQNYYEIISTLPRSSKYIQSSLILDEKSTNYISSIYLPDFNAIFDRVSFGGSLNSGSLCTYKVPNKNSSFVDTEGNYVYPSAVKIVGYPLQYVTIKVDNWAEPARLYTDKNGYLFPWLTYSEHDLTITTDDGGEIATKLTPSKSFSPTAVVLTPVQTNKQTIDIGIPNTEVKYGYDNLNWTTETTDINGNIVIDVELGKSILYIKTKQSPVTAFKAAINNDIVGTLIKILPSIISQTVNNTYVVGEEMALYVDVKASDLLNTLSYQWYKDGTAIDDVDSNVLNQTVTADSFGSYMCKITESNGSSINSSNIVISEGSTTVPEDDYNQLQDLYNKLQEKYNELKTNYDNLVSEDNANKDLINTLRDKIAELEHTIADLQQRIIDKDGTIADLTKEVSDITNTVGTYESLLDNIREVLKVNTNEEIITKIQEILEQLESLRKNYGDLSDEYEEYKDNAQTTIESLTEQLKKLQEQLDSSSVELDDVKKQLADVLIQSTDLRSLLDLIKAELGVTEDSEIIPAIQDLKRKYNDLRYLYNQLVIENSSNSTTIITLTERITELESLITILEKDAKDNADTIENLQNRVSDLTSEVESYKTLIESIKTLLGINSKEDIIPKIQELLDDLSELQRDYENLSQSYDDYKTVAQEKITELKERISSLENELADGNIELGIVKDQLAAAMIQITDLTSLIDEIKRELGVDSNEEIIPAIQELKRKYEELKSRYDALVSENNTNSTTIITLTERIVELETIINRLESDATTNSTTLKELQDKITELTVKITEYETLIESIRVILEVTTDDEILPKIQEILKQLEQISQDYGDLSDEYNEYKVNATNSIQELTLRITQLEQDLINKNTELDVVKRELADALAKITDLRSLVNQIKTELGVTEDAEIIPAIKALKDRITGLENQVTNLQEQLNSANDTIADLTKDKNDYNERIEDMKNLVDADSSDDIESKIQDMKDLIAEYEEKISQLEKDKYDLEKVMSDQQNEIQELKEALKGNTQDLLDRISELEKKVQDLENKNIEISSQVDTLNQSISDLTTENTELKKLVIELQTALDTANDTIEELRKKITDLTVENLLLKDDNSKVKAENEELKNHVCPSNEELLIEIEELNKEIEKLKKNQSTNSSTVAVPDNSVVLTPTTNTDNIIEQTNNKVSAESGWELNTSLEKGKWTDEVPIENLVETTGTFTFFTGKDLAKAFSSYVEKTVVYARKKAEPNNVYVCSFNIDKGVASYTSPKGAMTSDTKGVTFVYDESNTKVVNTTGKVTFNVDGDFGVVGKKGIYYKVVAVQNDFDPDGSWKEVKGNTFIVDVNEQVRVYIKYVDNYGNYTVNKTTVLDSSKRLEVPVLQFNKTIYLGNSYKLQLDAKGNNVMYKSSDKLVATVDENGLVTAKYNGKAKINCTVFDEKGVLLYRYEVLVTVKESNNKTLSLKKNYSASGTDDIILQSYKLISEGKSTKLSIKANKDAKVMYVTSDNAVATVNSKGIVTGKAKGSADITVVVYQNDKFYTYMVKVRVTDGTKDKDKEQYLN